MTIIRINDRNFESWRSHIEELLNCSVQLNFPGYHVDDNYGKHKCEDLETYIKNGSAIVFGAVEGNELIGWVWCHRINRLNKERLHIAEIGVKDTYHRHGVGKLLLSKIEQYGIENGVREIDLLVTKSNQAAVHFYENASYEIERYLMKKTL